MSLSTRLRAVRDGVCSARELDRLAGLTPGHTSAIESGRRPNPESTTLDALARVLGFSLDWFVRGIGEPPTLEHVRASVAAARTLAESEADAPIPYSLTDDDDE